MNDAHDMAILNDGSAAPLDGSRTALATAARAPLGVDGKAAASSQEALAKVTVGISSSISLSAATGIFFPASCNFYFGTSAGSEPNYFNSTAVSNGTCTQTLSTTAGALVGAGSTPRPVGNAMRWILPVLRLYGRTGQRFSGLQSDGRAICGASDGRAVSV